MKNSLTILVVEDDISISNFIAASLEASQYKVIIAAKGSEAVSLCSSFCPDAVLLDLGLPDTDGINVLKSIRGWSDVPVIVVSARDKENDKITALDLGADDYVTKPFGSGELLARIRTALRHKSSGTQNDIIKIGELTIDNEKRIVMLDNQEIHLTPIEYKIILLLAQNAGKVLTNDNIMRNIWGPYTDESSSLRVNMANIRRKIEANPAEPKYIRTEIGVGYRMME